MESDKLFELVLHCLVHNRSLLDYDCTEYTKLSKLRLRRIDDSNLIIDVKPAVDGLSCS